MKTLIEGRQEELQAGRKYLQTTYLAKDWFLLVEYKKKAWYSREKKQQQNIQLENVQKTRKDISPKRIYMANKYIKRCLTSLAIMEMQIKTTISLHVYQKNKLKVETTPNTGNNEEQLNHSYISDGNAK